MQKILAGFLIALFLVFGPVGAVLADDVTNSLDVSVDAAFEAMGLTAGGAAGTNTYSIVQRNSDGKNGCNLTGSTLLAVSVVSSNPSVATVDLSTITFTSCGDMKTITVTPLAAGTSSITLTETSNTTAGTFALNTASFQVTVTGAPADVTDPILALPADIVAEATSPAGATVSFVATATDNDPANPVVVCDPASGSVFPLGSTVVDCSATDTAGNTAEGSFTVTVQDTIAPSVLCDSADGLWHAGDASVGCTASDGGAGLLDPTDASFSLMTNVSAGTEDANASTGTRNVCDAAGNCTLAGPVAGNMVDKAVPSITITTPADGGTYTFHQTVAADYGCADGGSGVADCLGTVATSSPIDTSSIGAKSFIVTSNDNVGNTANTTVSYTVVGYTWGGFKNPIAMDLKTFKKTSTIPVKFVLANEDGSAASQAVATLLVNNVPAAASGSSNTGNYFRYDPIAGQYIFNLSTKLLTIGANTLKVTLDDGSIRSMQFTIR
jgi:hypothetical protein